MAYYIPSPKSYKMLSTQALARRPLFIALGAILTFVFVSLGSRLTPFDSSTLYFSGPSRPRPSLKDDINNNTLGFEKIFVVSLPTRTDRRDGMVLDAALSELDIEFIDGVFGKDVPNSAIPSSPDHERLADPSIGSWRGHMNAIQEVVKRNLSSALIMEDDADWDIRIKQQLRDFSTATNALTQPIMGTSIYADPTFPAPDHSLPGRIPDLDFHDLPPTAPPKKSPYGDGWDVLWLGHCGMHFPSADRGGDLPRARVVWEDQTVPQRQYLWTISQPDDLREEYPNHTRVVHHTQEAVCSLAYAVTQKAARQLLYEIGLKDFNAAYDILLRWFCEGLEGRGHHRCLTVQPSLFQHHRPAGALNAESDIADHGDGWRDYAHTNVLRWSVRMNAGELMNGGTNFKEQWPDV